MGAAPRSSMPLSLYAGRSSAALTSVPKASGCCSIVLRTASATNGLLIEVISKIVPGLHCGVASASMASTLTWPKLRSTARTARGNSSGARRISARMPSSTAFQVIAMVASRKGRR